MALALGIEERNPWGRSAQSACRWAYALLASGDAMPSVLGDLRGPTKAKRDLAILELRAQGAQIRGMVENLEDPIARAYLVAFYMPKPMEERQQGGGIAFIDRFRAQREPSVQVLAQWLLAQQGTGPHRIRGYIEIVSQYCLGDRMIDRMRQVSNLSFGIDRVAKALKMRTSDAGAKREDCIRMLRDLDTRAHSIADAVLYEAGLV